MPNDKFSEDMSPTFPSAKIDCINCKFKKSGIIGYKNAYCGMYPRGKPNEILFKDQKCQFKIEEAS